MFQSWNIWNISKPALIYTIPYVQKWNLIWSRENWNYQTCLLCLFIMRQWNMFTNTSRYLFAISSTSYFILKGFNWIFILSTFEGPKLKMARITSCTCCSWRWRGSEAGCHRRWWGRFEQVVAWSSGAGQWATRSGPRATSCDLRAIYHHQRNFELECFLVYCEPDQTQRRTCATGKRLSSSCRSSRASAGSTSFAPECCGAATISEHAVAGCSEEALYEYAPLFSSGRSARAKWAQTSGATTIPANLFAGAVPTGCCGRSGAIPELRYHIRLPDSTSDTDLWIPELHVV